MPLSEPYLPRMALTASKRLELEATELDRREGGGERVRLLWIQELNELLVEVLDISSKDVVLREVPAGKGLEAFNHPYGFSEVEPSYDYKVVGGEIEIPIIS